jgi:hypothetical protein
MSLLHQRLNSLFEARKKPANKAKPKSRARKVKPQVTKKDLKAGIAALKKKHDEEAEKARKVKIKAAKKAEKAASVEGDRAYTKTINALGDGKDLIQAARFLHPIDRSRPDFAGAKPHLSEIYDAFIPYFDTQARFAAAKRSAGVSGNARSSKPVGWAEGDIPARAARMRFASLGGPSLSDAMVSRSVAAHLKALAGSGGSPNGKSDYEKVLKNYDKTREKLGIAVDKARDKFNALVKAGGDGEIKISPRTKINFAYLKALKSSLRGIKGTPKGRNARATINLASDIFVENFNGVLGATRAAKDAKSLYDQLEAVTLSGGGEGIILPHEVANEFFVNMGISKTGKSAGQPKAGFHNLISHWGHILDKDHPSYQKTAKVSDAVSAIGRAFYMFATDIVRDQGLGGSGNYSFVTMPSGDDLPDAISRDGVDTWNAGRESLKGSLRDFFRTLDDDARKINGEDGSVDAKALAKLYIEIGGADNAALKTKWRSRTVKYKTTAGGRGGQKKIETVIPTNDDFKKAAAGLMRTPEEALLMADALSRSSLAETIFGPANHPLMRYNDFFVKRKSYLHTKEGSKADKKLPPSRSLLRERPKLVKWDRILAKGDVFGIRVVEIPGYGRSGETKNSKTFAFVEKLEGKAAEVEAQRIIGADTKAGTPGLWTDLTEFLFDQKAVKKLANKRFAPTRGRGVWGTTGIGDTTGRFDVDAKRADKKGIEAKRVAKLLGGVNDSELRRLRTRAKTHKGATVGAGPTKTLIDRKTLQRLAALWGVKKKGAVALAVGEFGHSNKEGFMGPLRSTVDYADVAKFWGVKSPKKAAEKASDAEGMRGFDSFLQDAAKLWKIQSPKKAAMAAEKYYGKGGQRKERLRLQSMTPQDFVAHLQTLPLAQQDAAKLVRVGIVGDGLTEQKTFENTVIQNFIDKLSPFFGDVLSEGTKRQTNLVRRLRECFSS